MDEDPRDRRIRRLSEALRAAGQEAAAARAALCENELVIRLDTIQDLARKALDEEDGQAGRAGVME
ncbi:hypothetical protein [Arenibaculum pallidiluteum]|uniref:hypothetical protein n=1 Tax=Arenibaculum pallidiluteum TaxID=2812559 RepID=UPI001A974485|nr:hypothetical protein [Arenibaculum pallidiluteum]